MERLGERSAVRPQSVPPSFNPDQDNHDSPLRPASSHGKIPQLVAAKVSRSRAVSTLSDGRASPYLLDEEKRTTNATVELALQSDPRYKRYGATIEKALQSFESIMDWADFISFLSRLQKALLSTSPSFPDIPHKFQLSKRLSQGLNPALPSGVHTKTLEIYKSIFILVGPASLSTPSNLRVWSSGLLPFFQYASTALRSTVLELYETYYITLPAASLRVVSKALILSVLPGLEEEAGDHYERVMRLLIAISNSVGDVLFFKEVLHAMVVTPGNRLAVLNYLAARIPLRLKEIASLDSTANGYIPLTLVVGTDPEVLIRALIVSLADPSLLVCRSTLDLLNSILPLATLSRLLPGESRSKTDFVGSLLGVTLRRDLSLSRRVHAWLLQSPGGATGDSTLNRDGREVVDSFRANSLGLVTETLKYEMLECSRVPPFAGVPIDPDSQIRPFKIFIALLDKTEIGYPLSEALAFDALKIALQAEVSDANCKESVRVAARAVYQRIEPYVFWGSLYRVLDDSNAKGGDTRDAFDLLIWVLLELQLQDDEVDMVHLPLLLSLLLAERERFSLLEADRFASVLKVVVKVLPWKTMSSVRKERPGALPGKRYYRIQANNGPPDIGTVDVPSSPDLLKTLLDVVTNFQATESLHDACELFKLTLTAGNSISEHYDISWDADRWLDRASQATTCTEAFENVTSVAELLLQADTSTWLRPALNLTRSSLTTLAQQKLLEFLEPQYSSHHTEAAGLLWRLSERSSIRALQGILVRRISNESSRDKGFQAFRRFWDLTHNVTHQEQAFYLPLLYVLDSLHSTDVALRGIAERWMKCDADALCRMIQLLRVHIFKLCQPTKALLVPVAGREVKFRHLGNRVNLKQIAFILDRLTDLIEYSNHRAITAALKTECAFALLPPETIDPSQSATPLTYQTTLLNDAIGFAFACELDPLKQAMVQESSVHLAAISFLSELIHHGTLERKDLNKAEMAVLERLYLSIYTEDIGIQTPLLKLLRKLIIERFASARTSSIGEKGMLDVNWDKAFLLETILLGISTDTNQPIVSEWLDFISTISARLPALADKTLLPVALALCKQFAGRLREIANPHTDHSEVSYMLQTAVTILCNTCLDGTALYGTNIATTNEPAGLFGYVSTVLTGDVTNNPSSSQTTVRDIWDALQAVVDASLQAYVSLHGIQDPQPTTIINAAKASLSRLYKWRPTETLECIIEAAVDDAEKPISDTDLFTVLDGITTSAHELVQILSDILLPVFVEPNRHRTRSTLCSPSNLLVVLLAYITQVEAPVAIDILPAILSVVRAAINSTLVDSKRLYVPKLARVYFKLLRSISSTSAFNDRKLKREALDNLIRLLDSATSLVSTGYKSSPRLKDTGSQGPNLESEKALSEPFASFLVDDVLEHVREVVLEEDRLTQLISIIGTNTLMPLLKTRTRGSIVNDDTTLQMLFRFSRFPQGSRYWKPYVNDVFLEGNLSSIKPEQRSVWSNILRGFLLSEKEKLHELLDRAVSTTSAANLFVTKDQDAVQRASIIRRISLSLFVSPKNTYLAQLPNIQAKLVEILKTSASIPVIMSEVYLSLQVILCRFSGPHITGILPIIAAELMRGFDETLASLPGADPPSLRRCLSMCKLLDLVTTLQIEEFQIYQWLFVTDSHDAYVENAEHESTASIEAFANAIVRNYPDVEIPSEEGEAGLLSTKRRPLLARIREIQSVRELYPYLRSISGRNGSVTGEQQDVDYEFLEGYLELEVF